MRLYIHITHTHTHTHTHARTHTQVFVSPAVSGPASFKTKNLEPLARGLPVVTTRLGALGLHRPPAIPAAPAASLHGVPGDGGRRGGGGGGGGGQGQTGVGVVPGHPALFAQAVSLLLV